jgi:hypothetical protein
MGRHCGITVRSVFHPDSANRITSSPNRFAPRSAAYGPEKLCDPSRRVRDGLPDLSLTPQRRPTVWGWGVRRLRGARSRLRGANDRSQYREPIYLLRERPER